MHAGRLYASIGNAIYARTSNVPGHTKQMSGKDIGLKNVEADIVHAIAVAYGGSALEK